MSRSIMAVLVVAVEERDPDEKRLLKTRCSPRRACRRRQQRRGSERD
jgi:hypothetical protein